MKLSVVYDSKTGNTKQAAEWIAQGMQDVAGVEARTFSIHDGDEGSDSGDDFIKESSGIVVGSPSYAANMTPDMHNWLLYSTGKLDVAGKLAGGFATEQYSHGGGELVIQSIITLELVKGMLVYSGGGAYGHPVIHLGPVGVNANKEQHNGMDKYKDYFMIYGKRFAEKAVELFAK